MSAKKLLQESMTIELLRETKENNLMIFLKGKLDPVLFCLDS